MSRIKPLPSQYNGYSFRSRTEARWAVFMDALRVPYEYEREAYDLDGVFYLPDFWLPSLDAHLEIKGEWPTEDELQKARRLSEATENRTYILIGQPQMPDWSDADFLMKSIVMFQEGGEDYGHFWCECPKCGLFEIQFEGRADRNSCKCVENCKWQNFDSERLKIAYSEAKGYRFEPRSLA